MIFSALFSLFSSTNAAPLEVGAPAPTPAAIDENGEPFSFADQYAKGPTLVYFYPKADTPGCTKQACNLRDSFAELEEKGLHVVGVSVDKPAAQKAFKDKYKLPFPLVADSDKKVAEAFGVPVMVVTKRQSFLVRDGKIVWRDLSAKPATQAANALAALQAAK